jgi:hypothetical protein
MARLKPVKINYNPVWIRSIAKNRLFQKQESFPLIYRGKKAMEALCVFLHALQVSLIITGLPGEP